LAASQWDLRLIRGEPVVQTLLFGVDPTDLRMIVGIPWRSLPCAHRMPGAGAACRRLDPAAILRESA
jgi:hypothetical protein